MIRIRDISLRPGESMAAVSLQAAKALRVKESAITQLYIYKKSIDARKKKDVRIVYTVDVAVKGNEKKILKLANNPKTSVATYFDYTITVPETPPASRPVVIGFGPAGMFAGLVLAEAGLRPIILERGQDAKTRHTLVQQFWQTGRLDPECNVQFGEGGAGTFSDGKLGTGTNNPRIQWVLSQLAAAGAPEEILFDAKPHVGTDVLVTVVQNIRKRILALGADVQFGAKLTGLELQDGKLSGVRYQTDCQEQTLACQHVILAIGHSARDTVQMLHNAKVPMAPKPFSMGVRIEHRQQAINQSQYGPFAEHAALPAADYKLNCHLPDGSSAYTFCMCPGGVVVAAASELGGVVTNGMSYYARDLENANSALLVTLNPAEFPDKSVLGGMYWQQELERACFLAGGSKYFAPAQLVGDFLQNRPSTKLGTVQPTYRPGVTLCNLADILPQKLTLTLRQALQALDQRLSGFACPDAVLTAPETRSSSPVRILRGDDRQSAIRGLYPCGEGAGYAGGITSAAVDGMLSAEALLQTLSAQS